MKIETSEERGRIFQGVSMCSLNSEVGAGWVESRDWEQSSEAVGRDEAEGDGRGQPGWL